MKPPVLTFHPGDNSRLSWWLWVVALYTVLLINGTNAWADENIVLRNEEKSPLELGYDPAWSREDYMNAKPLIPQWDESILETMSFQSVEGNMDENLLKEGEGMASRGNIKPDLNLRIHLPTNNLDPLRTLPPAESSQFNNNNIAPKALPYLPFSSSLVNLLRLAAQGVAGSHSLSQEFGIQPLAENEQRTDLLYPYSTVGKLYFRKISGGQEWSCSGAVIRHRLVVTAASCVHSGSGGQSGWYKDFRFAPAYRNGSTPYGVWYWSAAFAKIEWMNSGGALPHPTDYAILAMGDNNGRKIWQNTGYLGWRIKSASFNPCNQHLYGIGYPSSVANIPNTSGEMRQITGEGTTHPTAPTICILGTDWGKGSGGGPWVWKFGWKIDASGNRVINDNRVVSVFSTVFTDSPPGVILKGGSVFDARWSSLMSFACADDPGNCTN